MSSDMQNSQAIHAPDAANRDDDNATKEKQTKASNVHFKLSENNLSNEGILEVLPHRQSKTKGRHHTTNNH